VCQEGTRSLDEITDGIKPIDEELKKEKPHLKRLNALVRNLERQRGTIPAKLNRKVAEINSIITNLDDGKTVFPRRVPPSAERLAILRWMLENGSDVHQGGGRSLMCAAAWGGWRAYFWLLDIVQFLPVEPNSCTRGLRRVQRARS
jgi:hypothetical protein